MKQFLYFLFAISSAWIAHSLSFHGLGGQAALVVGLMAGAVILWVSEVIPLYITGMMASFCLMVLGDFTTKEIFHPYFDPIIMLFFGGFILARALQKYDLDSFFAQKLLSRAGSRPRFFILMLMAITAFMSLWMSNTASAAIMIPLTLAIIRENQLFEKDPFFSKAMVLSVAYAATIGGVGSLVGSPPNAIAVRFLAEQSIEVSFLEWMLKALPFALVALIFIWLALTSIKRPQVQEIIFSEKKMKAVWQHKFILFVFALTVVGWLTSKLTGISSSTIALIPVILLFSFGILKDRDLHGISWGTLLLFGSGLSLGSVANKVGLGTELAEFVSHYWSGLPTFAVVLALIFIGILVSMLASNTASAVILIPLVLPLAGPLGVNPQAIALLLAVGVSLDFMMPVGTPPNAIAYSTGLIKVREMVKIGVLINLGTGLILGLMSYFFLL